MNEVTTKRPMKLIELLLLWIIALGSMGFFLYKYAPEGTTSLNELLLTYAQEVELFSAVLVLMFVIPFTMIAISYGITKLILSRVLKTQVTVKKSFYTFLVSAALIFQMSYFISQFVIEKMS